jgi:signal transduction histidine kinase
MSEHRILVVEDHEPLLEAIQEILATEGYDVLRATDGLEALAVMERTHPDLILADIMMPNMDGYDLYEEVRAHPKWVTIPFIFLTAKASKEDRLRGKSLGVEDYITKPFEAEELVVAIDARLKRAQAIRKATESEFDLLKQQIVTALGHELRTPLTYVRSYTEMALDDIPTLTSEELDVFLQGIKRGADRLTRLVDDLLLLVRLDTGRTAEEFKVLAHVTYDPGDIIRRTVRQHRPAAVAKGLTIECQIPDDLPPVYLCEFLFVDALGRLIENGIKFSQDRGECVTVDARVVEDEFQVSVTDQGIGIRPEQVQNLFQRFHQIDRETMEQQGVGLGLSIAQELVKLHHGKITVESALGQGSTFTIHLPLTLEEEH